MVMSACTVAAFIKEEHRTLNILSVCILDAISTVTLCSSPGVKSEGILRIMEGFDILCQILTAQLVSDVSAEPGYLRRGQIRERTSRQPHSDSLRRFGRRIPGKHSSEYTNFA